MKSFLLLFFIFSHTLAFSQVNVLFEEDFEDAQVNVTYTFPLPANSYILKDTSDFYTGNGRALYMKMLTQTPFNQPHYINLPTLNFNNISSYNSVELQFDHIARLWLGSNFTIEYSTDNKASWNTIFPNVYRGKSAAFLPSIPCYFSELVYLPWRITNASGAIYPNDSTLWRHERFEIKSLFNLVQSNNLDIRFKMNNLSGRPTGYDTYWGLFMDNIKILASNCNVIGQNIAVEQITTCALPTNTITANVFPHNIPLSFTVDYPNVVDSLYVTSINNGVLTYNKLDKNAADKFAGFFTVDQPGDSILYKISVVDTCGMLSTLPTRGFYTFNAKQLPSKCGPGGCTSAYNVTHLPYLQDFEANEWQASSTRGTWPIRDEGGLEVFPDPSLVENAWCVAEASQNPSSLAGPGILNDPKIGQKYLLFRPDIGGTGITSSFKTPCIQVPNDSDLVFSFDYYMFGPNMGSLHIDIDTSSTFEQYILNHLVINGQQHGSQGQAFKTARISLKPFAGKTIRIRVRAKKQPSGNLGYIAVDNLQVNHAGEIDFNLSKLSLQNAQCGSSNGDSIYLDLTNFGGFSGKVPLVWQLNNTIFHDTIVVASSPTPTTIRYSLNAVLSNIQGTNLLKIWHQLPGDNFSSDDTISLTFFEERGTIHAPYFENFDTLNTLADLSNWELSVVNSTNQTNPNITPKLLDNIYPSYTSGPADLIGGKGKYLSFTPQNVNIGNNTGELIFALKSSCIDLSNLQNPRLSFLLHFSGGYVPLVKFLISTDDIQFHYHNNFSLTTQASGKALDNYQPVTLDLSPYAGQKIRIKIELNSTNTTTYRTFGLGIDNLSISSSNGSDLALLELSDHFFGSNTADIKVQVANMRPSNYNDTLTLHLNFIPECGGPSLQRVYTSTSGLNGNTASEILFTNNNPVPPGAYHVKAYISAKGDSTPNNDSLQSTLGYLVEEPLPYFNDFETCLNGFKNEGEFNLWERKRYPANYIPRPGNYALSADSAVGFYHHQEIIVTPRFVGLDTLRGINLSFYSRLNQPDAYGLVEMNYGTGWIEVIGDDHKNSLNWPATTNRNFTNQSPELHSIELILPISISSIRFRFKSTTAFSSAVGAWIIDDLRVSYGAQHDVAPVSTTTPQVAHPNKSYPLSFKVTNYGKYPLSNFNLQLIQNQTTTLYNGNFNAQNPIPEGQSRTFQIPVPIQFSSTTSVAELQFITALPNNRVDGVAVNDTSFAEVHFLSPEITPYCNDFETGIVPPTSNSINTGSRSNLWENGSPVKGSFNGAFGGTHALATKLTTNYDVLEDEVFYLPIFNISDTACYSLSFDHQFNTERNFDGGTIEYSVDSGTTWLTLGKEDGDTNWFNTKYIQSLDFVKPGFSGNSGGYIKAIKQFSLPHTGSLLLRFRFASNVETHFEGWAIDNICFEKTNSNCAEISLPENIVDKSALIDLYPNPANSEVRLSSKELHLEVSSLQVYSASGKTLSVNSYFENSQTLVLPIQQLSPGFYWVQLVLEDGSIVQKKFIKQ